jgi:hypothetical protein
MWELMPVTLDEECHPKEVEALLEWVHTMDGRVKNMASVCTVDVNFEIGSSTRFKNERAIEMPSSAIL